MTKPTPLTKREALKAIRWYFRRFGLQDWTPVLEWTERAPDWATNLPASAIAGCSPTVRFKRAYIWIRPAMGPGYGEDPLETVFHECGHVLLRDLEEQVTDADRWEFALTRLSEVMAELYRSKDKGARPLRIARDDD